MPFHEGDVLSLGPVTGIYMSGGYIATNSNGTWKIEHRLEIGEHDIMTTARHVGCLNCDLIQLLPNEHVNSVKAYHTLFKYVYGFILTERFKCTGIQ